MGRLLITFFLVHEEILREPILYVCGVGSCRIASPEAGAALSSRLSPENDAAVAAEIRAVLTG